MVSYAASLTIPRLARGAAEASVPRRLVAGIRSIAARRGAAKPIALESGRRGGVGLPLDEQQIGQMIEAIAGAGDRDAFAALFRHFVPRLRALGLRGGASVEAAEELAQETMIAVWRKAALYDRRQASGSTWIF